MKTLLTLETPRLQLRPYRQSDLVELVPLIGAREVAATTARIPHPYTEQDAREFLSKIEFDDEVRLSIRLRSDGRLIGGVGLRLAEPQRHAELGYWLGVPYWGNGYATEAARRLVEYGFADLQLHRIYASHFKGNIASQHVLRKLGMRHEGCQREHVCKWDQFIDSELYGILRAEWESQITSVATTS